MRYSKTHTILLWVLLLCNQFHMFIGASVQAMEWRNGDTDFSIGIISCLSWESHNSGADFQDVGGRGCVERDSTLMAWSGARLTPAIVCMWVKRQPGSARQ